MRKRLVIFALLCPLAAVGVLTAQNALKGTPEQRIAKSSSGQSGQQQTETHDNGQGTQKTPTAIVERTASVDEAAKEETRENLQIQRELSLFTGLLVLVGVLQFATMYWQARLLKKTREDVHKQAGSMETQAGHMSSQLTEMRLQREHTERVWKEQSYHLREQTGLAGSSASAARQSANAALKQIALLKQKERAWLSVKPHEIKDLRFDWFDFDAIEVTIENFGFTHALNVRAEAGAVLSAFTDREPDPPSKIERFEISDVVRSGTATVAESISMEKRVTEKDISDNGVKWMILIQGIVRYDDAFGDSHDTPFKRYKLIWRLKRTEQGAVYSIQEGREWAKTENPEDNRAT